MPAFLWNTIHWDDFQLHQSMSPTPQLATKQLIVTLADPKSTDSGRWVIQEEVYNSEKV